MRLSIALTIQLVFLALRSIQTLNLYLGKHLRGQGSQLYPILWVEVHCETRVPRLSLKRQTLGLRVVLSAHCFIKLTANWDTKERS